MFQGQNEGNFAQECLRSAEFILSEAEGPIPMLRTSQSRRTLRNSSRCAKDGKQRQMNRPLHEEMVEETALIIGNRPLASAIHRSVAAALGCPFVHLGGAKTERDLFKRSLDTAIRDIEEHPRGKLFRRLIEYGPHDPDYPGALVSDGERTLSDPECGSCVEFIYSHMVNRFKGELAELLALEPCIGLMQRLQQEGHLPSGIRLYWGEMVQERRRSRKTGREGSAQWGSFTKGADGLLVEQIPIQKGKPRNSLSIHGIVEVKSMARAKKKILDQINRHIMRLSGGVKLGRKECRPDDIWLTNSSLIRVMVMPSTWKLSREWHSVKGVSEGRAIVFPEPSEPPVKTRVETLKPNIWKITLAWSQEALDQAAYEMTFWYMSQVGRHVYIGESMPKGWEYMTHEEAGYNAIKMMLYYMPLRHISGRQERLATKLYNVYSFGYPLGVDSKEMLWPEDFPGEDENKNELH